MKRIVAKARFYPVAGALALAILFSIPMDVFAQRLPDERQIRAYIPPDQIVSFLPSTPFDRFIEFVDPIFSRVTGKQIVDPESRGQKIGVSIASMHFFDAFELVLAYNNLIYTETEDFFIIEDAAAAGDAAFVSGTEGSPDAEINLPATADTREIQINAILFELDHSVARDYGIDWSVIFGSGGGGTGGTGGTGGGGTGGGSSGGQTSGLRFSLKTDELFSDFDDWLIAPDVVNFTDLNRMFRILETEGVGETIANPSVTVTSANPGRIQIGSDVPVQVRDFAGNTVTQFFSTGIIVDVTPTMITQFSDSTEIEFIHLDVRVEKSGSRPSASGPIIDRNAAQTQVLLLDGEQTVIGGLYSTEETTSRKGIPILKDLPNWFFGLGYIFGRTQRTISQKELFIVLQARVLDDLHTRSDRPLNRELLEQGRQERDRSLRQFDENASDEVRRGRIIRSN